MEYLETNNKQIDQDKTLSHKLKKSYLKTVLKINLFKDKVQNIIFYPNLVQTILILKFLKYKKNFKK